MAANNEKAKFVKSVAKIDPDYSREVLAKVYDAIKNGEEITMEEIWSKTGDNFIQPLFFRLHEYRLVRMRFYYRDDGILSQIWSYIPNQLEKIPLRMKKISLEEKEKKIFGTQRRLAYERSFKNNEYYSCGNCRRYTLKKAEVMLFQCPVCKRPISHWSNKEIIEKLVENEKQLGNEIEELKKEIEKMRSKRINK